MVFIKKKKKLITRGRILLSMFSFTFRDVCLWEVGVITSLMKSVSVSHSIVSNSLRPHGLQTTRLLCS